MVNVSVPSLIGAGPNVMRRPPLKPEAKAPKSVPVGENFSILPLPRLVTYRLPVASKAMALGAFRPEAKVPRCAPVEENFSIVPELSLGTYRLPDASKARPYGWSPAEEKLARNVPAGEYSRMELARFWAT